MGRPREQRDEVAILSDEIKRLGQMMTRPSVSSSSRLVNIMSLFANPLDATAKGGLVALGCAGLGAAVQHFTGSQSALSFAYAGVGLGGGLIVLTNVIDLLGGLRINVTLFHVDLSDNVLSAIEQLSQIDDGVKVPKVQPVIETIERQPKHTRIEYAQAPVSTDVLARVAYQAVVRDRAFSRQSLTDAGACSQGEYNALAKWMDKQGYTDRVGNSRELNESGKEFLLRFHREKGE